MSAYVWVFGGMAVWLVTFFGAYLWGHSVGSREGYIDGRLAVHGEMHDARFRRGARG